MTRVGFCIFPHYTLSLAHHSWHARCSVLVVDAGAPACSIDGMKSEGTEGTAIRARSSARKADETFEHLAGQAEASPKVNWDKWTLAEDGTWERTYAEYTHVTLEARKIFVSHKCATHVIRRSTSYGKALSRQT